MRDEKVETRKIEIETADFRTYKPETFTEKDGTMVTMRLCEELVAGRWEPFYLTIKRERG
jgi:hypothetical protein